MRAVEKASKGLGSFLRYGVYACAAVLTVGLLAGSAQIITAGLLLLIALPVCRVGLLAGLFALERDWVFSILSLIVFGILISSAFLRH